MPYLGDYLGQLLSEIVTARAQVDVETIRVAEVYATHPYLKHFPVPHLRLPTVVLDLAYAIDEVEPVRDGRTPRGAIDPQAMRKSFESSVKAIAKRHEVVVDEKAWAEIHKSLDSILATISPARGGGIALRAAAMSMTDAVIAALGQTKALKARLRDFADELKEKAQTDFLGLRELPPRLKVLVTKRQLEEIKNPDLLSRLRLTVSEEGLEWNVVDVEGKRAERLLPE